MVRMPACENPGLKKGPWTPEEDHKLLTYIQSHGHTSWQALPKQAGLLRCGKSCRLRWTNYLRPGIRRGNFSSQEENTIIQLHAALGNRWSTISTHLPGRTDNEIKNHWNTRLRKRLLKMGIDPTTHRPLLQQAPHHHLPLPPSINTLLLSLLQAPPSAADTHSPLLNTLLLDSHSSANYSGSFPAAPGHVLQHNASAAAPPSPSILPPPAALAPAVLAAAETRLLLDCLKFNDAHNHFSTPDHPLNQTLTRLLLLKLLQGSSNHAPASSNPAACSYGANKVSIHQHIADQRSGPLSANHQLLQNQGLHAVASMNRETAAAAPAPSSACANPALNDNNQINSISSTMLLNMFGSSYQQRLLQNFPFLAESVVEPCPSAAAPDHLSSTSPTQLSQASFYNRAPELSTANGSLTSQQDPATPLWQGHGPRNEGVPNGAQGAMQKPARAEQVTASGAQLLAGGGPGTLMTWEELLMSGQAGREKELASSSTVSSSTLSSASGHAPDVPGTHNIINIQDYWSELLNLISSTK